MDVLGMASMGGDGGGRWGGGRVAQALLMVELTSCVCEPREARGRVVFCSPRHLCGDASDHIEMKTFCSMKKTLAHADVQV